MVSGGRSSIVLLLAILNTGVLIVFMIHVMTCTLASRAPRWLP